MAENNQVIKMPMLALRGMVVFPNSLLHFEVNRKKSISALRASMSGDQKIFLVSQKDFLEDEPNRSSMYEVGVISTVKQILNVNGEELRVIIEGHQRASLLEVVADKRYQSAVVHTIDEISQEDEVVRAALIRKTRDLFDSYSSVSKKLPPDMVLTVLMQNDCGLLADYIASNLILPVEDKQRILDEPNAEKRLRELCVILERELEIQTVEQEISRQVQERIDQNQREYYLREQMKVISEELGDYESPAEDAEDYMTQIAALQVSEEVREKLTQQAQRLSRMPSGSHEATVIANHLDACLALPWSEQTKDNLNLIHARQQLDRDHYGMEKVKDRMIEFLAVRKLAPDIKGQIICLVGPPGVGKTSIAASIAKALGRKYQRISLGGINDEAEIRGHRRTYIGAMAGRIMQAVSQAKSNNPLILLDEVDKLTSNLRGDPTSALLEVLDPEQNVSFQDHYIDLPFDLSKVLFITTANTTETIPAPLLDRMEVVPLSSYTREEKFHIAKEHLVTKQVKRHGLNGNQLRIADDALYSLVDDYTRESGVRNLERQVAALCRKTAAKVAEETVKRVTVRASNLESFLGPALFRREETEKEDRVGVVTGLAWTSVGGEIMPIEALILNGSGKLELTGSLGSVMKESARAAVSYIRSKSDQLSLDPEFYKNKDIHIHVPEGAIPKDGPSAGVTIATAVVSALTGRRVHHDVAMTGEITLTGQVLRIGGLKEKTMAAYAQGLKRVIIPNENRPDLSEVDAAVKNSLEFFPVRSIDDVLQLALD